MEMEKVNVLRRLAFTVAVLLLAASRAFAAEGLGERVLFDALQTPLAQWELEKGISAKIENNALTLRSGDADFGSAAPREHARFQESATADIEIKNVAVGQMVIQVEWLREDGTLVSAPSLVERTKTAVNLTGKKLADVLPKGEAPKKFRLKFWVEGRGAEAQITKAVVRFRRAWRKADTKLVKAFDGGTPFKADPGMSAQANQKDIVAKLEPKTGFSAFYWTEKVAYDPNGVVLLDLATLQGGVMSLQALCRGEGDADLRAIDLIKDAPAAGMYEVPLKRFQDQAPSGTKELVFKFWLAGNEAIACVSGLFYGMAP